jgi:hypothetical protein
MSVRGRPPQNAPVVTRFVTSDDSDTEAVKTRQTDAWTDARRALWRAACQAAHAPYRPWVVAIVDRLPAPLSSAQRTARTATGQRSTLARRSPCRHLVPDGSAGRRCASGRPGLVLVVFTADPSRQASWCQDQYTVCRTVPTHWRCPAGRTTVEGCLTSEEVVAPCPSNGGRHEFCLRDRHRHTSFPGRDSRRGAR